ncbi:MAG TPA: phosphate acyltransferase PlsX [Acidimicrobiales bacterium]|nr:phosphate acyltransferase PlsX [Acidimicrobiales bacterium]
MAVDAMGGDRAPGEVVAGALRARQLGIPVVLVGRAAELGDTEGLEVIEASQVVAMDEDPSQAVRRKKDSSLVRAAEAVRDGRASAMVSAGNTGAAMAAALLRMGRLKGVARPAIATPLPVPGSTPNVLIDAGANAECTPAWLVQFAQMGAAYARERYGVAEPRVGLLSIGEEPTKGSPLVKQAHAALAAGAGVSFVGNVEGRDLLTRAADVVVTDGFTGNVALKTLEGGLKVFMSVLLEAASASEEAKAAAEVLLEAMGPAIGQFDPDRTGGALLLGVDGVCVISHGSSSAAAIESAVSVAWDMAGRGLVRRLAEAISA